MQCHGVSVLATGVFDASAKRVRAAIGEQPTIQSEKFGAHFKDDNHDIAQPTPTPLQGRRLDRKVSQRPHRHLFDAQRTKHPSFEPILDELATTAPTIRHAHRIGPSANGLLSHMSGAYVGSRAAIFRSRGISMIVERDTFGTRWSAQRLLQLGL